MVGHVMPSIVDTAQPMRLQEWQRMEHPKDVGDGSLLAIMAAFRAEGLAMYVPFGENTRSDLIIETENGLARIQCKTGRLRGGAVVFRACSSYAHHRNPLVTRRDYQGQVDAFAVYCPETGGVYVVPIGHLSVRVEGKLRVDPPRNGQRKNIRLAADYEIGQIKFTPTPRESSGAG
jgi:hypothetical protein